MSTATPHDPSKPPARRVMDHIAQERFTGLLRVRAREASGEFWFLAGMLEEAQFGVSKGDEAVDRLHRATELVFEAELRLPNLTGGFKKRMAPVGTFAEARPVTLMRYCETFALTCQLELKGKDRTVRAMYRIGELLSVDAGPGGGNDVLPALLESEDGTYEFVLPPFELPASVNTAPTAAVGLPAGASRPSLAERIDRSLSDDNAVEAKLETEHEAQRLRLADDEAAEAKRRAEAAAEAKRKADAERAALEADAAAKRKAEEAAAEAKRLADRAAAEARRKADEAAAQAKRKAEEAAAEAKRKAEESAADAKRKAEAAAADAHRRTNETIAEAQREEAEAKRKAEERAQAQRSANLAAEEAKRKVDADEAKRKADADEAKRKADADEAKRKADADEAKRKADADEAKRKAAHEVDDATKAREAQVQARGATSQSKRAAQTSESRTNAASAEPTSQVSAPTKVRKKRENVPEAQRERSEPAVAPAKGGFSWSLLLLGLAVAVAVYFLLDKMG